MAFSDIPPLDWQTPIVDPATGRPSPQFLRLWQQMFGNTDFTNDEVSGKQDADVLLTSLSALADPNADKLLGWDDSAGNLAWIEPADNLAIDGTDLDATGGFEGGPVTPPTTADLATWDNQGTSTVTDGTGAMVLKPQVDAVLHGRYKTAPSTPWSLYCRVEVNALTTNSVATAYGISAGILLKDTGGDNERLTFAVGSEHNTSGGDDTKLYYAAIQRWTGASPPVFSSTPVLKYAQSPWKWLKVDNDGTTLTMSVSPDGKNWIVVGTETLAAFIDGAASFGVYSFGTSATEVAAVFSYFSTTAPV